MQFTINTNFPITFEKIEDIDDSRFTRVKLWICHTEKNVNNSYFSKKVVENEMLPSLANIPILGFIEVDSNNEKDFKAHEEAIIIEKDDIYLEYRGRCYGVIPESNNAQFEKKICDDGIEREFLTCDALMFNKFDNAIEILDRDQEKSVSMELDRDYIEGKFSKDGVFHFTKARIEGVCILGKNYQPGMTSALIEKYSKSNLQFQFAEMIKEFNQFYSKFSQSLPPTLPSNQSSNGVDINYDKGGQNVDEILKCLEEFSLTKEQLLEFDSAINFEEISVDDLKLKIDQYQAQLDKKSDEPNAKTDDNPSINFSLTGEQFTKELKDKLAQVKVVDDWGWEYRRYSYADQKDNFVFALDKMNNWNIYKFEFSTDGDNIIIDFESGIKQKIQFADWEEGSTALEFSFVPEEYVEDLLQYKLESKEKELKDSFIIEKESISKDFTKQINKFTDDIASLIKENDSLVEYKNNKIADERKLAEEALFVQFEEKLSEEEIAEFKKVANEFTLDQLEDKLYSALGRKNLQFTAKKQPKDEPDLTKFNFANSKVKPSKTWAELVESKNDEE